MQAIPETRRSDRFGHEYIIKLEDDRALSPYYAVSYNLSETGMYFKSLFELYPGVHIFIRLDDYTLGRNQVPAKVVWCKKLEDTDRFRYGVGVEFLKLEGNSGLKTSLPAAPRMKTVNKHKGGVVIKMEKR
jgi:Tfp pilus assembly protein PilZ